MSKQILFGAEAREKLQKGVDILANAIRVTMGPKGKLVTFERGTQIFSLDGVSVAREIFLKDPIENAGANMAKSVAIKTDKEAGNGTSASIILFQEILREGLKSIVASMDMINVKVGINKGLNIIIGSLKKVSIPVKSVEDLENVADISARDKEIGKVVGGLAWKLGEDAIIAVEESNDFGISSEIVNGFKLESGYLVDNMVTNRERQEVVLEDPYILVTDQNIKTNQDISAFLEMVAATRKKTALVIANDVTGEALISVVINKIKGSLNIAAIKAPGVGADKDSQLEDICALTGAKLISEKLNKTVEDAELTDLGGADRVIITRDSTVIIGGDGKEKDIKARIKVLESGKSKEKMTYELDKIKNRLARLKGGVAVIKVGTRSEAENKEMRYRIEDAVRSAQSALSEGIIQGAGMTLYRISEELRKLAIKETDMSIRQGLMILVNATKEPAKQIITNAGDNADVVLNNVVKNFSEEFGYNPDIRKEVNLIESGIIDPTKVIRCALENAVSVVSLLLNTECVIAEEPEEKKEE